MFVGPLWPASVLVCLLIVYAFVALLGLIDLDLGIDLDADLDADVDVPSATADIQSDLFGGAGAATLRWLNLQRLPLVLWMSIFTIAFWGISYVLWYGFDHHRYAPTLIPSVLLVLRNGVISILVTKVLTGPLNRAFEPAPTYDPSNLIGKTCAVSTGEVSDSFGQAKFPTDAAPLLLNIRTDGETISKGSLVRIIAFDNERRVYKVTAASEEDSK
tara:strand:+ start:64885 stop:65532 length:648 start_codon:yes stop_codon:yes gene_type:complete